MNRLVIYTKECGQMLGRSPGAIRNMVYRKQIPYRKINGRLAFEVEELQRWLRLSEGLSADEVNDK